MKKTIFILSSALLFGFTSAEAQEEKGNSFILASYHNPFTKVKGAGPNQELFSQNGGNFTYVRSITETFAMRYGIGVTNRVLDIKTTQRTLNDTTYYNSFSQQTSMPHLILGKEWRKMLHPDVMIVGGGDIWLGGGSVENLTVETNNDIGNYDNIFYENRVNNGAAVFASFNPFMGARVSWERIALGYSVFLPIEVLGTFRQGGNSQGYETRSFTHNISAGYRIYNYKKEKLEL